MGQNRFAAGQTWRVNALSGRPPPLSWSTE